jgi:hypothetical protein
MHIESFYGLDVLILDEAELEDEPRVPENITMLQIHSFSEDVIATARERGFFYKPQKLFWALDLPEQISEYLEQLPKRYRKNIRRSIHCFENSSLTLQVEPDLKCTLYLKWLALYREVINSFEHGSPIADESFFDAKQGTLSGVFLYHEDQMVAGNIAQRYAGGFLMCRFGVIHPAYRDYNLMRFLDFATIQLAYRLAIRKFSLGTDPNLYGYSATIGLYHYKKSLGLRPFPRRVLNPKSPDVLQKVVNFDAFSENCFFLSYGTVDALRGILFSKSPVTPGIVRQLNAPFLEKFQVIELQ